MSAKLTITKPGTVLSVLVDREVSDEFVDMVIRMLEYDDVVSDGDEKNETEEYAEEGTRL